MTDLFHVLLHGKPVRILLSLKRSNKSKYASILSREAHCTYSHTVKILNAFEEAGLVEFRKEGRKKLIMLTDQGEDIATTLEELHTQLDELSHESV